MYFLTNLQRQTDKVNLQRPESSGFADIFRPEDNRGETIQVDGER